jgi:hypothetical protein
LSEQKSEGRTYSPRPVAPIPSASKAVNSVEMRTEPVALDGGVVEFKEKALHATGQVTRRHAGRELTRRTSLWPSLIADMMVYRRQ